MKKIILFAVMIVSISVFGQSSKLSNLPFSNSLWIGLEGGLTLMHCDYKDLSPQYYGRFSAEYFLESWELGSLGFVGYGSLGQLGAKSDNLLPKKIHTKIWNFGGGLKFVYNASETIFPYILVSGSNTNFKVYDSDADYEIKDPNMENQQTLVLSGELGVKFPIHEILALKVSASLNRSTEDWFDNFWSGDNVDWYSTVGVGLMLKLTGGDKDSDGDGVPDKLDKCPNTPIGIKVDINGCSVDTDGDGLTDEDELRYGTDPTKKDTDGDGLSDSEEIRNYKTNPLKADSDGDGLNDGDEVNKYKTDPLKVDTDGDSLSDGDEVLKHKTSPLKKDTDGDDLTDAEEINSYKTDPLKVDTDADGLKDNVEIKTHKTDPLKKDTDGGSILDGVEIMRNSNPLDPKDDIEALKLEEGKNLVLEGIVFATGSATIQPESETILRKVVYTLRDNPDISVEIQGHTDNRGRKNANITLSLNRANSVKEYLVAQGIDGNRISTKGFGPDRPIATNNTEAGRQQNRRIEFSVIKK